MGKTFRRCNEDKLESMRYDLRREMADHKRRVNRYINITYCKHGRPSGGAGACCECDKEENDIEY